MHSHVVVNSLARSSPRHGSPRKLKHLMMPSSLITSPVFEPEIYKAWLAKLSGCQLICYDRLLEKHHVHINKFKGAQEWNLEPISLRVASSSQNPLLQKLVSSLLFAVCTHKDAVHPMKHDNRVSLHTRNHATACRCWGGRDRAGVTSPITSAHTQHMLEH